MNALVALHHRVPVVLISGDEAAARERSVSRFAAESLHPERTCELIRAGATRALARAVSMPPPAIDLPATIELTFLTANMAEMASWIQGVERTEAHGDADPIARQLSAGITSAASRSTCRASSTSGLSRISSAPASPTAWMPAAHLSAGPARMCSDQPSRP